MIKSVTVMNHIGEFLTMELSDYQSTGLLISDIKGISPGDAIINTTDMSVADGSVYNSSRIRERNIVFSFIFFPKPTIEDTRQITYRMFPLKKYVTLFFETDNREVMINGYVESNDVEIFSEKEGTQISIICPNPYFYSISSNTSVFSGIEPLFEFPFSNESLTEDLIEFSEIRTKYENSIYYYGDAETGITILIHFLGPAKNITVYNVTTRQSMVLNTSKIEKIVGSSIEAGDDIVINTSVGKKSATFIRHGKEYNILNSLGRTPDWIKLDIGENILAFTAEEGETYLNFSIVNDILYEGI